MFTNEQIDEIKKLSYEVALKLFREMVSDVVEQSFRDYKKYDLPYELETKIRDELPYLIPTEVERELKQQGIITRCKDTEIVEHIREFYETMTDIEDGIVGRTVDEVYKEFLDAFKDAFKRRTIPSKALFTREIRRLGGYKSKVVSRKCRSVRIYTR